jgi:N utilization substance protein B
MQLLYTLSRDEEFTLKDAIKQYYKNIDGTFSLYLFNLYVLQGISSIALIDNKKRKSKYLPSQEDKGFIPKLYMNEIIQAIVKNSQLNKVFEKQQFKSKVDEDFFKKLYNNFSKEESYSKYIINTSSTKEDDLELLLELYRFCRKDEYFNETMEDSFASWFDDKSIVIGAVKKTLKALPSEDLFFEEYRPDDDTTTEFGEKLLKLTNQHNDEYLDLIKPTLKNWDHDRLAALDIILINMALCEFIEFASIPTKVTLNEFVEISKIYSTPKSKDFINGILDRLLAQLIDAGKVKKEGRGLVE